MTATEHATPSLRRLEPISVSDFDAVDALGRDELRNTVLAMATEMKPQLTVESVRGDGNCFFRAVAMLVGSDWTHERVRVLINKEVLSRPTLYSDFVANNDVQAWAAAQEKHGIFSENISPKIVANIVGPVVIWRKHLPNQAPTVFVADVADTSDGNQPLHSELDECGAGMEHWAPLVVKPILPASQAMEETEPQYVSKEEESAECENEKLPMEEEEEEEDES